MRVSHDLEFAQSEIAEITKSARELLIRFTYIMVVPSGSQTGEARKVPASITITQPRFKSLPKKGLLSDGELYGIPGKPLNGRVPVNFRFDKGIELVLVDQSVEHSIHGQAIVIQIDSTALS
jgi:hypothetical protein